MDNWYKKMYFLLGVMTTIMIGWISTPFWYLRQTHEQLYYKAWQKTDGEITLMIGHGKTKDEATPYEEFATMGNKHDSRLFVFKNPADAVLCRNQINEAIDKYLASPAFQVTSGGPAQAVEQPQPHPVPTDGR